VRVLTLASLGIAFAILLGANEPQDLYVGAGLIAVTLVLVDVRTHIKLRPPRDDTSWW